MSAKTREIKKAAVLGSGVMGMAIASHLAGCGIDVLLLDIVPFDSMLSEKEQAKRDAGDKGVRNKLSNAALKTALKYKPPQPAFYSVKDAERISTGNFDDDLEKLGDCDWVVEVVVERMDIKKQLFAKVDKYRGENTIVTSNTSGLSIETMVEDCSEGLKRNFLGTHFFNPVRFMKLLEIIPHPQTDPELLSFMENFCKSNLGKGVINAKDTPNFIANRIGIHSICLTMQKMMEHDLRIDEVDVICGKPLGNARSAVFKTADLVGLDTMRHVANTVYDLCTDDEDRELVKMPEFVDKMVDNGWLGRKAKSGFYKLGPKRSKLVLDWKTMGYIPQEKASFDSVNNAKEARGTGARIKALVNGDDKAAKFAWEIMAGGLLYAANRVPEIADTVLDVDNGMCWGFNREIGPFAAWDAIGVRESVERMKAESMNVPSNVETMLAGGNETFYKEENGTRYQYDLVNQKYIAIEEDSNILILKKLPAQRKVDGNDGVTLWDIGDGVLLYEMHTPKANAVDADTVAMQNRAVDLLEEGKFEAMVVGNNNDNFCVGANLMVVLMAIHGGQLDQIEPFIYEFQKANMRMKYCSRPIVAATSGYVFGGGCEIVQHCHKVVGAAESYIGLVEVGVGLIPAGGGTKEMMVRAVENVDNPFNPTLLPFVRTAFQNIATAEVGTGFKRSMEAGYVRPTDIMEPNAEYRLTKAKQVALAMAAGPFDPGSPRDDIPVVGESGAAAFTLAAISMNDSGWATDYDLHIAKKLAWILGGGSRFEGQKVSEWELLDMEREVFMSLLGEEKTQERIQHMLMTRKPLRN